MPMQIGPNEAYPYLAVPDDWGSVTAFAEWYMRSGAPMLIPWDAPVIRSDDATAICLFRKGRFQVELYLILPGTVVPDHGHPGVQSVLVPLGGGSLGDEQGGLSSHWGRFGPVLSDGLTHGGGRGVETLQNGFAMLAFQMWDEGLEVTSVAIRWVGNTAGPLQDALIRKHYPNAVLSAGVADVRVEKPTEIL